jgi:ribulose-5-phosphate 4-epimerase/fuculose-1-phosphate aldolase
MSKRFVLDLTEYSVEAPRQVIKEGKSIGIEMKEEVYPLAQNLSVWLRTMGIFRSGEDIAEAVVLAKQLREYAETATGVITLDEREAQILKEATNKLIQMTAEGRAQLGGELHEEAICRVINMKETEE